MSASGVVFKDAGKSEGGYKRCFQNRVRLSAVQKITKLFSIFLFSLIFTASGMIGYSLVFPRTVTFLDELRLSLESPVLKRILESEVGRVYLNDENIEIEGPTDISFVETNAYRQFLEPGDVIFTSSRRYLGAIFIKGKWKHSAIYLGTKEKLIKRFGEQSNFYQVLKHYYTRGDEEFIIDSSLQGVKVREIRELSNLKGVSYLQSILAFRPEIPSDKKEQFIYQALKQVDKKYDFDLLTYNRDSLYCSELLYTAFKEIGIKFEISRRLANRKILIPSDIVQSIIQKRVSRDAFSFLFFIEKKQYKIVEHSVRELM